MNLRTTIHFIGLLLLSADSLHAAPSVKDAATAEAAKFDLNGNGRLEGAEVTQIRMAFAKDPTSLMYIFDENGNKALDEREIAAIRLPVRAPVKR